MPRFTPQHRGGSGPPLVCLHGFADSWRSWELVLPALERRHDVLALTLAGHAGGPPLDPAAAGAGLADAVEDAMDRAGLDDAHLVGNSLGGHVALELAARGRARSVVALAPAGGWAPDDRSWEETLDRQEAMWAAVRDLAPHADALAGTAEGRRRATALLTVRAGHLPRDLVAHLVRAAAACDGARTLLDAARRDGWPLDPSRIACPVRVLWGTEDRLLPWPRAAVRYRDAWLPQADWVVLDGVGHCPQLDVPLETAELVLGFTAR